MRQVIKNCPSKGLSQHIYQALKFPSAYKIKKPFKYDRVGVLTFMVKDATDASSEDLLRYLAGRFEDPVVKSLKAAGEANGVEFVSPDEFLVNDEVKNTYQNMVLKGGVKAEKVASAPGYTVFPNLTNGTQQFEGMGGVNRASFMQIGQLMEKCNLDAVVVLTLTIAHGKMLNAKGKEVKNDFEYADRFFSFTSNTILKNQTPFDPNVKYPKILGGYVSCSTSGYSILNRGGLPLLEYRTDGRPKYESAGLNKLSMVNLKLVADYSADLENVL